MRRMAELYGAWIFGVLCTCGLAYWLYRRDGLATPPDAITQLRVETEPESTDDTGDTVRDDIVAQIRPRFRG